MTQTGAALHFKPAENSLAAIQGISPYQNAVLVDSSSRVLTLSENLHALLANGAGVDEGLVRRASFPLCIAVLSAPPTTPSIPEETASKRLELIGIM